MLLQSCTPYKLIFDFNNNSNIENWIVVNDAVMGGKSFGKFSLNHKGNGVFSGDVSLENNGGFSSVGYNCKKILIEKHNKVHIKLKGDGKKYQFRIKNKSSNDTSYITSFLTTGEWQEVTINLNDLQPNFRGNLLKLPNFSYDSFEEIRFLIANKKEEAFKLIIAKIELK